MTDLDYFCGYKQGSIICGTCSIRSACPNVVDVGPDEPNAFELETCKDCFYRIHHIEHLKDCIEQIHGRR